MVFHTRIAYSFEPQRDHGLVLHLTSADRPEMRFALPSGNGAFNHFYCELLKAGMSETEWNDAVTAIIVFGRFPQPLPSLDLDDQDVERLKQYHSTSTIAQHL